MMKIECLHRKEHRNMKTIVVFPCLGINSFLNDPWGFGYYFKNSSVNYFLGALASKKKL